MQRTALLVLPILSCMLACVPEGDDTGDEGGTDTTDEAGDGGYTGEFEMTASATSHAAGASAVGGQTQVFDPDLADPWLTLEDFTPEVFDAHAEGDGGTGNAHFEILRDEDTLTLRATVDGASPGEVAAGGTAAFTELQVCGLDGEATAMRFTFECTGTVSQTGNSGIGAIELKHNLLTHCRTMTSLDVDLPWEYPDGLTFESPVYGGAACETFVPSFTAGAGFNGIDDNAGSATAAGEIIITVESIY